MDYDNNYLQITKPLNKLLNAVSTPGIFSAHFDRIEIVNQITSYVNFVNEFDFDRVLILSLYLLNSIQYLCWA